MELYSNISNELRDSLGTRTFMERIRKLITAMMSRTPENSLRENSDGYKVSTKILNTSYGNRNFKFN